MTLEEQLKTEILSKYKSIRAFTTTINIPYSTLDSVFKRGIANAGVSTMIKVFNALDLDIESIQSGELRYRPSAQKNPPDTEESAPEGPALELFNYINNALIAVGFIGESDDITDQQAEVILGVCRILHAVFYK